MIDNIPTLTSSVTTALLPTQLIVEILISRGMLYFPSRTNDGLCSSVDLYSVLINQHIFHSLPGDNDREVLRLKIISHYHHIRWRIW